MRAGTESASSARSRLETESAKGPREETAFFLLSSIVASNCVNDIRKRLHSFVFQFLCHHLHGNASASNWAMISCASSRSRVRVTSTFAVITESIERGRRNGIDGVRTDQIIHINGVRIGRILGAGGCPQRTLDARTLNLEILPTTASESLLKCVIGKFCIGDRRLAAQS